MEQDTIMNLPLKSAFLSPEGVYEYEYEYEYLIDHVTRF